MKNNLENTQANRKTNSMVDTQPSKKVIYPSKKKVGKNPIAVLFLLILLSMSAVMFISATLGHYQGKSAFDFQATHTEYAYLHSQLELALEDIENENYNVALQRLDFIYKTSPEDFTLASDLYEKIRRITDVTATPTPQPTAVVSPTPDLRPAGVQFENALQAMATAHWELALQSCLNLRKTNPDYKITEIDQMVYVSLRMLGVQKILQEGKFESGIYDFALAEQYGILDFYAVNLRDWANLYLLGNSFWLAYPEIAASYYGQVAGAMPHLRDESGSTAFYRYWMSLIHIAEQLVDDVGEEEWCESAHAYQNAFNAAGSEFYSPTATYVWEQCVALTPTNTPTPSITPTTTATIDLTRTITATTTPLPTETFTPTPDVLETSTETTVPDTETPVPDTETPEPTPTDTPIPEPLTDTPEPTPSDTPSGVSHENSQQGIF